MTNTEALEKLIKESGFKKKYIAKAIDRSPYALQKKIRNENEFTSSEIATLCELLKITSLKQKEDIFFTN